MKIRVVELKHLQLEMWQEGEHAMKSLLLNVLLHASHFFIFAQFCVMLLDRLNHLVQLLHHYFHIYVILGDFSCTSIIS